MTTTALFKKAPSAVVKRHRTEYRGGEGHEPDADAVTRAIEATDAWLAGASWGDVEDMDEALRAVRTVPPQLVRRAFGAPSEGGIDFWHAVRVVLDTHMEEVTGLTAADRSWP